MDIFLDSHFWFLAIRLGTAELDNTNHKKYCLVLNKYNILNIQIHFFLKHEKHKPFFDGTKIKFDVRVCFFALVATHTRTAQNIRKKLNGQRIRFQILDIFRQTYSTNHLLAEQ